VDGGFTQWTKWSECSETCGSDSIQMRMRVCTNPPPSNGGKDCQGWRFEVKYCNLTKCPVNGGYTSWSEWSPCTPSCGPRAFKMRQRTCTNPPPRNGGLKCFGGAKETKACRVEDCPVDGGLGAWSKWSPCSKTCNTTALSRRERKCDSPPPRNGGKPCAGERVELRNCGTEPCPVDGGFSPWSEWSHCPSVACGTHFFSKRTRTCTNPMPKYGGKNCTHAWIERKRCALPDCPVDGGFSEWSAWSACPSKCSTAAYSHRRRRCDNPEPRNGGRTCVGPEIDAKLCWRDNCPVNGGFTPWTAWSNCSQECGRTSIRSRERYCTNPVPENGGKPCKGNQFEIKICKFKGCKGTH
ncbi:predicted protein, partial [Nematostella vectensis]